MKLIRSQYGLTDVDLTNLIYTANAAPYVLVPNEKAFVSKLRAFKFKLHKLIYFAGITENSEIYAEGFFFPCFQQESIWIKDVLIAALESRQDNFILGLPEEYGYSSYPLMVEQLKIDPNSHYMCYPKSMKFEVVGKTFDEAFLKKFIREYHFGKDVRPIWEVIGFLFSGARNTPSITLKEYL